MPSSHVDAATEALIAQLMADDLGESYYAYSAPIGASYQDYEEPLSSYERQCLDAKDNTNEEGEAGSGWGPEFPDEVDGATDGALYPTGPPDEGASESSKEGWNSRFVDEDGQVQSHTASKQSQQVAEADEDVDHSDSDSCSAPTNGELTGSRARVVSLTSANVLTTEEVTSSPARVVSLPSGNIPTNLAGETRNLSAPMTVPTQPISNDWPGPNHVPSDQLDPSQHSSDREPFVLSSRLAPNEPLPDSSGWETEGPWDDGLDYSLSKGKGRAVRAYDEFRRGLRDGEKEIWDPEQTREQDADHETEEEGEIDDEDLPFIRIPWPCAENDELLSRREDSEVVEIRLGDDETLESILRDISLRDERRQKGKGVEKMC